MLNQAERFKVLKTIKNCCTIGYFPAIADLSSWQLVDDSQKGKQRWKSQAYFVCFVIHAIYIAATFISAYLAHKNTPPPELIIHGIMALNGPVISFWIYQMFFVHRGVFGAYLHMTLTGNMGGNVSENRGNKKWTCRLKEYTLRDLIAICLPYMSVAMVPTYLGAIIFYPKLDLLLFSGLPETYQTWLSFSALLLEEMRYVVTLNVTAIPMWILQIISIDTVKAQLKHLTKLIERARTKAQFQRIYSYLRRYQLCVAVINEVNRNLIFSWKLHCIIVSISSGYAAIAHFTDHPVFGFMYYMILIDAMLIYTMMYGNAFECEALFEEAKRRTLFRLKVRGNGHSAIVKRQMRAVPRVGIEVGEFHMMERQSVPTFVHYVLSNIVTMLVAYKH